MDLVHEIGRRLGRKVVIQKTPFDTLVRDIAQGRFDMAAASMVITEERKKVVEFSLPYFNSDQSAARHGCEIRERTRAHLDDVRARAVVVAAGSWVNDVLAGTGFALPVTVTREQVAYYAVPEAVYAPQRFPVTIEHRTRHPFMISMFPELSSGTGIKLMRDRDGPQIDPEDLDHRPHQSSLDLLTAHARRRLRGLGPILRAETCRYTMLPGANFVLQRLPGLSRVAVVSACSGHGFKFAPQIGEMAVDLVVS